MLSDKNLIFKKSYETWYLHIVITLDSTKVLKFCVLGLHEEP